jgi:hypothetical protein
LGGAEVAHLQIESRLNLTIGVLREADATGLGDPFEPRGDVYPIAHEIAVALLDHVAEMDADAILDSLFWWQTSVAFG